MSCVVQTNAAQLPTQDLNVGEPFEPNFRTFVNGALSTLESSHSGPVAPGNPVYGEIWANTLTNTISWWNGSSWVAFGGGGGGSGGGVVLDAKAGIPYATQAASNTATTYSLYTFSAPGGTLTTTGQIEVQAGFMYINTVSEDHPTFTVSYGGQTLSTTLSSYIPTTVATGTTVLFDCIIHSLNSASLQDARCTTHIGTDSTLYSETMVPLIPDTTTNIGWTVASASSQNLIVQYRDPSSTNSTIKLYDVVVLSPQAASSGGGGGGTGTPAAPTGSLQTNAGGGNFGAYAGASVSTHQFVTGINTSGGLTAAQPQDLDLGFTDNISGNVSTGSHGFVPKAPGGTTQFLRADTTWAVPPGSSGGGAALDAQGGSPFFTQAAAQNVEYAVYSYTLPAAQLGTTGRINVEATLSYTNVSNTDAPSLGIQLGSTDLLAPIPTTIGVGTDIQMRFRCRIETLGNATHESASCELWIGNNTGTFNNQSVTLGENSANPLALKINYEDTGANSSGTSTIKLFGVRVEPMT